MKILAIDPGRDVGLSANYTSSHAWQVTYADICADPHAAFFATLKNLDPEIIVYERFDYRQGKRGVDYTANEYIGIIKLYAQMNGIPLAPQGQMIKSRTKGFWSVKKLKYLGLYIAGDDYTDAMDALCHRLHYELSVGLFDITQFKHLSLP